MRRPTSGTAAHHRLLAQAGRVRPSALIIVLCLSLCAFALLLQSNSHKSIDATQLIMTGGA